MTSAGSAEYRLVLTADATKVASATREVGNLQRAVAAMAQQTGRVRGPDFGPGFGMQLGPRDLNPEEAVQGLGHLQTAEQRGRERASRTNRLPREGRLSTFYSSDTALDREIKKIDTDIENTAKMREKYPSFYASRPNIDSELRAMKAALTLQKSGLEGKRDEENDANITPEAQHAVDALLSESNQLHSEFTKMGLHGANAMAAGQDQVRRQAARTRQMRQQVRENAPYFGQYYSAQSAAGSLSSSERQTREDQRKLKALLATEEGAGERYKTAEGVPLVDEMERMLQRLGERKAGIDDNRSSLNPLSITSTYQQSVGDDIKAANDLRDAFRDLQQTVKLKTDQEKKAAREAQAPGKLQQQAISDANRARNIDKQSIFGRVSRAASWLMPQQGYMASGAMDALGIPFKFALGAQGALMAAMFAQQAFDMHAAMMGQGYQIAAMTGVSPAAAGYGPSAYGTTSLSTADTLRNLGLSYGVLQADLFKSLTPLNDYNVSNPNSIVDIAHTALAQSTFSHSDISTSMKAVAEMVQRLSMNTTDATNSMMNFDAAIMATQANAQVATTDLANFAGMLPQGTTGLQDIAGFSKFAGEFGLSATQMFGPTLGATGTQRIQMSALLGMTPDQYMEAQKTAAGRKQIADAEMAFAKNIYNNMAGSGAQFTATESVLQGLGFFNGLPQGTSPDVMMNALLGGRNGPSLDQLLNASNVTAPSTIGDWFSTMGEAARGQMDLNQWKQLTSQYILNKAGNLMLPSGNAPGAMSPLQNILSAFTSTPGSAIVASPLLAWSRILGIGGPSGAVGQDNFWKNPTITINLYDQNNQLRGSSTTTPTQGTATNTSTTVNTVLPNSPRSGWDVNRGR